MIKLLEHETFYICTDIHAVDFFDKTSAYMGYI